MSPPTLSLLLKARAQEFCERYLPNGKQIGNEWLVGDPYGAPGKSTAVQLTGPKRGLWIDRANPSEHGDLLGLLEIQLGDKIKSYDEARRFLGLPEWKPGQNGNGHVAPPFNPLSMTFTRKGQPPIKPVAAWPYHSSDGQIVAYTCRFQNPDGSKDVIPMRLIDGKWRWKGWTGTEPRPIYNLHHLTRRASDPVLIVEGEKTADAAARIFPKFVVITWQGGSKSVERADLSPLLSRKTPIVLWPDADPPGRSAMTYLKARLPSAVLVKLPPSLPDGWDLADPAPDFISPQGLLDAALNPPAPVPPISAPYRALGEASGDFYYLNLACGRITHLRPEQHTELNIHSFAPDSFWRELGGFELRDSNRLDYKLIAKRLMSECDQVGWFNPDRIRGRGVWIDGPNVVIHAGDSLFVDGIKTPLSNHKSAFIYPRGESIPIDLSDPLPASESQLLSQICDLLPWAEPDSGWLFSGYIFASLVEGALYFRPNAWLFGEADSGKSWSVENIVKPVWGPFCIQMAGSSSEASFRQVGRHDALSFLVDEFETETDQAAAAARRTLFLMRQSTTETNAKIYRGTPDGHAVSYSIRSNFLFSSIAVLKTGRADQSRLITLELVKRPDQSPFNLLKSIWNRTVSIPSWCQRLRARALLSTRAIVQSAETFSHAIRSQVGDSRTGLLLGAVAAGHWILHNDSPPTADDAAEYIASHDLTRFCPIPEETDHSSCLNHLLQSRIRSENNSFPSVGRLLLAALSPSDPDNNAAETLLDAGIRTDPFGDCFDVANSHPTLRDIFRNTHWADKWPDYLAKLGQKLPCTRFRSVRQRAVRLHRNIISPSNIPSDDPQTPPIG